MPELAKVREILKESSEHFRRMLLTLHNSPEGLTREMYIRYLAMQYHLTNGVQRHFYQAASHPSMNRKMKLKKFLIQFGNEEELHYAIAEKDLKNLNADVGEAPLDTKLWWAYFDKVVQDRPLIRLGATCILENIAIPSHEIVNELFRRADYTKPENMRFFTIHQHGPNLDHGNQIFEVLESVDLVESEIEDLNTGAENGSTMYLRMAHWAIYNSNLKALSPK